MAFLGWRPQRGNVTAISTYGGSAQAKPPRWSGGSRPGLETRSSWWLIRRTGRRRASLRRRLPAPPRSVRRVRCSRAVYATTPMSGDDALFDDDARRSRQPRIALARPTSPTSSRVEPHQDTHQGAVSAGHSVARRALRSAARQHRHAC